MKINDDQVLCDYASCKKCFCSFIDYLLLTDDETYLRSVCVEDIINNLSDQGHTSPGKKFIKMVPFSRLIEESREELFTEEILRSFNGVSVLDDHGQSFSTNISLLAALVPSLGPPMREGLLDSQEIQLILSGYSKETLNHLDDLLHSGEVLISFVEPQQCAQSVIDLKHDLQCLGLNPPEEFWTVLRLPITKVECSDDNIKDMTENEDVDSIDNEKPFETLSVKQEPKFHNIPEDALWVKHNKAKGRPTFFCLICKKYFKETLALNHHLRLHHPDLNVNLMRDYDCKDCFKTLKGQMRYFRHITNAVCKSNTTVCDLCGESFLKSSLLLHKRLTHTVNEQKCDECGKTFQNQYRLKNHIVRKHGVPIPCDFCGKLFRGKYAVKKHVLNKHTADEDKQFSCELCGKRYGVKKNLEMHHLAAHSGGKKDLHCRFCDYKTWSRANRDKHERTVHKNLDGSQ